VAPLRTPRGADASSDEAFARGLASTRERLVVGALAAWMALVVLATLLAWRQYDDAKRQAEHDQRNRAILAGTVFDTYFAGQIGTLQAMAAAPSVRSGEIAKMQAYFALVRPDAGRTFTAGIGWLDRQGYARASSVSLDAPPQSYADRSYFEHVLATGRPYISQALVTRRKPLRRVIVMAVPTRDERNRISGVLTGALLLRPSADNPRSTDLGYAGLEIVDRAGQRLTLQSLERPRNFDLVRTLRSRKEGVLSDTRGLEGAGGHVVAFATSTAPGWTIVIDRPAGAVFASARRSLLIELAATAAAAVLGLVVIAWGRRWSRRQLRDERSRIGAWAVLTRSLNGATDPEEVQDALVVALAAQFPTGIAVTCLWPDEDRSTSAIAVGERSPFSSVDEASVRRLACGIAPDGGVALHDRERVQTELPELAERVRPAPGSVYAEQLRVGGRSAGAVAVVLPLERELGDDDRAVVRAHADQTAEALARIAQHRVERETATVLQRSLLPARLPQSDGIAVAARYRAGGDGVEVGGDWYDVVRRTDGIVHLTVGDVAGHGIPAATLMGQLRTAFSAYAFDHASPSEIVRRVGRHVRGSRMVTMVCVTFDPLTRELTYSSAGHPPPLLIDGRSGALVRLDGRGRPPLGWDSDAVVEDQRLEVGSPATLVLYTDGLVERRDRPIDDGIDRLGALVAASENATPAVTADHVLASVVGPDAEDDAALLLVRLQAAPARIRIEIPAQAPLLGELRRRLRAWLSLRGIEEHEALDIVLAVSEACNNAIEHAYRDEHGTVVLELGHDRTGISIVVEDHGAWRATRTDTTRGRGLAIMQRLMPATTIERGPQGTRVVLRQTPV
jgi:serine phosphatase RsbU (regulator of sigma subunit)/anti-sigma regulatory factor (Ser/Thr protein kinase)